MKYLLDYGHGGNDPGAIGIDGVKEKDIVLEIGKRVKYHLERHGQIVIESRDSDKTVSLSERSNKANVNKVDLCISIHCNALQNHLHKVLKFITMMEAQEGNNLLNVY